jgi:hypothetical protein
MLVAAASSQAQLRYSGQVHARDLERMLEELLYFYCPLDESLSSAQIQYVLSAFRTWATHNCVSIDADVRHGVHLIVVTWD